MKYEYDSLDAKRILNIVEKNNVCVLGTTENNMPYVLPMNYESDFRDNTLVIKMKSKSYGKKTREMNNNDKVCLYFDRKMGNYMETVVASGRVNTNVSNKNKTMTINIIIDKITGRRYKIK